jgi:acetyl-CoA C-acetyltransferase
VLDALVARSGVDPAQIEDVIMGCVMQAGEQSTNVARNAVLASRLPESVPGTSVDRQCGSSQQALHFAAQAVMAGSMDVVIAAGVESMTRVPMGLPSTLPAKNGFGTYMSPQSEARYPDIQFSQFMGAEMMAKKYDSDRTPGRIRFQSHQRAIAATQAGSFKEEIVPLRVTRADGTPKTTCTGRRRHPLRRDAGGHPRRQAAAGRRRDHRRQRQPDLRRRVGRLVVSERGLKALGVKPLARIHHMSGARPRSGHHAGGAAAGHRSAR